MEVIKTPLPDFDASIDGYDDILSVRLDLRDRRREQHANIFLCFLAKKK